MNWAYNLCGNQSCALYSLKIAPLALVLRRLATPALSLVILKDSGAIALFIELALDTRSITLRLNCLAHCSLPRESKCGEWHCIEYESYRK